MTACGSVFYKMSGSGNDFVVFDGRHQRPADWPPEEIAAVCDRRQGVGADGLVILTPAGPGRVRMDYWNCDGSPADMCGNAALCSTRLAVHLGLVPGPELVLETAAGAFLARCRPGPGEEAELNLPDFAVPETPPGLEAGPAESNPRVAVVGVPHLVLEVTDLERSDLMARGRTLRRDPALGPAGANVNFVAPANGPDSDWCLRTYERGVEAETLACGTGAVASAVALAVSGRATLPVRIRTRSGRPLHITATVSDGYARNVWLAGEGRLVFRGVLQG
ncbi:MAG TPA: diaminopimelate epimerase [Gemmatimonadales bacterium]|nr:diaminopimelate epimerase [Gemmatimonadales bacterium]